MSSRVKHASPRSEMGEFSGHSLARGAKFLGVLASRARAGQRGVSAQGGEPDGREKRSLSANRDYYILDVSKEQLARAPIITLDQWPVVADATWLTGAGAGMERRSFSELDTNKDGYLTKEEAKEISRLSTEFAEVPELTLKELGERYEGRFGRAVSKSSMDRALRRLKVTRKKRPATTPSKRASVSTKSGRPIVRNYRP
jgi:hypothetical protein